MRKIFILIFAGFIVFSNMQTVLAYPKPVAVIVNYDKFKGATAIGRLTITRANGQPNGSEALLYNGDQITGDVGYIKIDFAPYADFYSNGQAYVITYNPPSGVALIAQNVVDSVRAFWYNVEKVTSGSSRGPVQDMNFNPQPGYDVTLFLNEPVRFSCDESANKIFSVCDDKGKIIFKKKITGSNFLEIVPKEIKLKAGKTYIWNIEGDLRDYKITVLDEDTEKFIWDKLAEIDSENISAEEKLLKKSSYLQLISDIYPDKFDFYWLSTQWLVNFNPQAEELKELQYLLLRKCIQNLDSKM